MALAQSLTAKMPGRYDAIHSGTPWMDQRGLPVSANRGGIFRVGDTHYLFAEAHRDLTNAFAGFNCYSSMDLINWRFESVALPMQRSGPLGPETVGEREGHAIALDGRVRHVGCCRFCGH